MQKYIAGNKLIPQGQRANINSKILYLVTNNLVGQTNITPGDIFNSFTGNGGLHGLERKDFQNYYDYSEAKKEVEQGQFFTPHNLCRLIIDCVQPSGTDIIYDLTFGMGNFFNYLPVESNIYGTEIDIQAVKVAKFLYPKANLAHEDIISYKPPVSADLVVGNPPFHLAFYIGYEKMPSHLYYCLKAAKTLKPAGLLAVIMPNSFLSDDFHDKSDIAMMNSYFNFIAQFELPGDAFKSLGIACFETKLMFFQKKRRFGLDLIMAFLPETAMTEAAFQVLCMNVSLKLRFLLLFLKNLIFGCFRLLYSVCLLKILVFSRPYIFFLSRNI